MHRNLHAWNRLRFCWRPIGFRPQFFFLIIFLASPFFANSGFAFPQDQSDSKSAVRTIAGQIVDPDGKPAAGCKVDLYVLGRGELESATCNDNGEFAFTLAENVPFAMIRAMHLDETLQAIHHMTLRGTELEVDPLHLQLEPTISTKVTVRHEGKLVTDAFVGGLVRWGYPVIHGRTDVNGEVILRTSVSFPVESIWVFDKTRGVAFWYPEVDADTVERARENQPTDVTLDLLPTRTCAVKVVDVDGKPVAGVEIFPYFRIEEDSNRKFFPQLPGINSKTSEGGIAIFDWMPAEPVNWFIPTLVSEEYRKVEDRGSRQDIRGARKILKVRRRPKKYPVRGRLVGPENANLKGVKVFGDGASRDAGIFNVACDESGLFQFDAIPETTYSLVAMHHLWASDVVTSVLLNADGNQIDELNLPIYAATKVTVSVTRGQDHTPVVRGDVIVEQTVIVPSEGPEKGDHRAMNTLRDYPMLKDNGQVTFGIGRGKWRLKARSGKWSEGKEIEITDSNQVDLQFHSDWMGENSIGGRLSFSDNTESPIALNEAVVTVIDYIYRNERFETHPGADGHWLLNADVRATFAVLAYSGDKKFGALKIVNAPDELPVTVKMAPTTTIAGTLVDNTGYPFAGKEIVLVYEVANLSRVRFGSTITNDDGEFQISGVITGLPLTVAVMRDSSNYVGVKETTTYQPGEAIQGLRLTLGEN